MNLISLRPLRIALFRNSGRVLFDNGIRRIHDNLCGPVILLQTEKFALRIILAEIQDILDFRATESINRLRIVTDHANILMTLAKFLKDKVL